MILFLQFMNVAQSMCDYFLFEEILAIAGLAIFLFECRFEFSVFFDGLLDVLEPMIALVIIETALAAEDTAAAYQAYIFNQKIFLFLVDLMQIIDDLSFLLLKLSLLSLQPGLLAGWRSFFQFELFFFTADFDRTMLDLRFYFLLKFSVVLLLNIEQVASKPGLLREVLLEGTVDERVGFWFNL
jgi:hypothetical protein